MIRRTKKDIKESKEKTYINEILNEIKCPSDGEIRVNKKLEMVPKNIAVCENPGKDELLRSRVTRFNRKESDTY